MGGSPDAARPTRVLLSYSHESEPHCEQVLALAERLRREGVDAWLDRYVVSPAEGWIRWMQREMEAADFALMVCTETYRRRFEGKEADGQGLGVNFEGSLAQKMIYAAGQNNPKFIPITFGESSAVIPVDLVDVARYHLPRDYDALYRRLTRQPEVVPPGLGALRDLPPRGATETTEPAVPPSRVLPAPTVSHGPPSSVPTNLPPRNPLFRGRVQELEDLHRLLVAQGSVGVSQRVSAWGHGGIGKSALSLEYGWQHLPDYPGGVFFLSADAGAIEAGLASLVTEFDPDVREKLRGKDQAETAANVRRQLATGERALLILDNVRGAAELRNWLRQLPDRACKLLITTRSESLPGVSLYPLNRLTDADAFALLAARRADTAAPENRSSVEGVIEACEGLAVALEAVGAYLEIEWHVRWQDYAADLRRRGEGVIDDTWGRSADHLEYPHSLGLIFSDLWMVLTPIERRALQLGAFLPPNQIPRSWLQALLVADTELASQVAPGEVDLCTGAVSRLLRLQVLSVADEEERFFGLHRLFGYWLRRDLDGELKKKLVQCVIALAGDRAVASSDARTDRELRWELRPLVAQCELILGWGELERARWIAIWVSRSLLWLGRYPEARTLLEAIVSALDDEHPHTLTVRSNLASTLRAQGELPEARSHQEAVLEASRRVLGDEHPDTLAARSNLASTLRAQGELSGARSHQEAVLEAMRRVLGDEHPATLTTRNNLASTLRTQGELSAARSHQEAVLEARRRLLGDGHPATLTTRDNLALTLNAQGELWAASAHQEAVLAGMRRVLGDEHPDTLTARNNLALTLKEQGELSGARDHQEAVLETSFRLLGAEHPGTLTTRLNLAATLSAQGDLEGARGHQEAVLEVRRRLQGDEHPDTLDARSQLDKTLKALAVSSGDKV